MATHKASNSWRFKVRKHRGKAIIGVVTIIAMVAAILLLSSGESDALLRERLEAEFEGVYPVSPEATGEVVEIELVSAPATFELVNGVQTSLWTYNGEAPGQEIRMQYGDTLRVTLRNELPVATTIHWHGVRVPNPMDGVPGVTQDAVEPGDTFVYEFTPPDAGTFFFHSHVKTVEQLERGLYGTLVVEDPQSHDYSQDLVWLIDDWSLDAASQLDGNFTDQTATEHNGRWGDLITVNGSSDFEMRARPGERIRLRFVNASTARVYALRFADPSAMVIAVDGLYTRAPQSADATLVSPGSRVDIDLTIPTDGETFKILEDFSTRAITLGTVIVEGESVDTPGFDTPTNSSVPIWAGADDVGVDIEFKLSIAQGQWQINGKTHSDGDPYEITPDVFTKVRFTNNSIRLHPMHMHGQFFKVLAINGEPVDEGFFRDSVLLFKDDVVDVGVVALDEGMWAMHCHILEHAAAGMITLVYVPKRSA